MLLEPEELGLLRDVVELFKVFEFFSKTIQDQSYSTLNSLVLFHMEITER